MWVRVSISQYVLHSCKRSYQCLDLLMTPAHNEISSCLIYVGKSDKYQVRLFINVSMLVRVALYECMFILLYFPAYTCFYITMSVRVSTFQRMNVGLFFNACRLVYNQCLWVSISQCASGGIYRMCACVSIFQCVYVLLYLFVCTCVYISVHERVSISQCVYVFLPSNLCSCVYIFMCERISISQGVYVYLYPCDIFLKLERQ